MPADLDHLDPNAQYQATFTQRLDLSAQWPGLILFPGMPYTVRGDLLIANRGSVASANTI